MKERAVFSSRVATARHSLSRAQRRSTRLRFWQIQEGQATAASLRLAGIAGRARGARSVRGRRGWRSRGRPRSKREQRTARTATAARAAVRAPAQARGQSLWRDQKRRRPRRPCCHSRRETDPGLPARRAAPNSPLFGRACGLVVRSPKREAFAAGMLVPSRNAIPTSTPPRRCAASSSRSQAPRRAQRRKHCAAIHHGPRSAGIWRHFAPLSWRQMIASIVRRRSWCSVSCGGRQASIKGASASHCASVKTLVLPWSTIRRKWGKSSRTDTP